MNAILLAITGWDPLEWDARFRALPSGRDIRLWPDRIGHAADIAYACVWKPPHGLLAQFSNLQVIFSLGAGVDALTGDATLPAVPLVRIVDADLTMRMTEYVVLQVLTIHRQQRRYNAQQRQRVWRELPQPAACEVAVGVMGLGVLGAAAVAALSRLGFQVARWSRTAKRIDGVATFHGSDGLDAFLARSEILVCLLPSTPATDGLLDHALLRKLRRDGALGGAYLINAGRGRLQVEADILAALDDEKLAGATLDVFATEPLPETSPFWTHPKVTVTPHAAAASVPSALVANVLRQIGHFERGEPMDNVIDRVAGY
ncbi:MAG: glyoxylate/hydroxypyruvate reductase A [Rhizobiales bacterium]|nr:glyoxylate/hydroxypyruvate reductase A [Hyphomicrobiales bacterium]